MGDSTKGVKWSICSQGEIGENEHGGFKFHKA